LVFEMVAVVGMATIIVFFVVVQWTSIVHEQGKERWGKESEINERRKEKIK
jgi:hypothetical protein